MVYTTLEMQKKRERKRNQERVCTNFVFRLAGESNGAVTQDDKRIQYMIDAITAMSVTYRLSFTDDKTEPEELDDYLSFARDFGLDQAGATPEQIRRMLPMKNGNFGEVSAQYDVRISEQGLNLLFRGGVNSNLIRALMRKMALANYLKEGPFMGDIAWCYATQEVHDFKVRSDKEGPRFDTLPRLTVSNLSTPVSGIHPPSTVSLPSNTQVALLNHLIDIEDRFVDAFQDLHALLAAKQSMSPDEYEKNLHNLGDALKRYDDVDECDNTVFAVLDGLIRVAGGDSVRNCSLSLTSKVDGKTVTKKFVLQKPVWTLVTAGGV
jgi:hypothetical protein